MTALTKAIGSAAGALFGGPKMPAIPATPTVDAVETEFSDIRRLRRRRGQGANQLLGEGGAESSTAPKQLTGE